MTQRASESLVAALIRIGLLLALAIMLMAENAQAQSSCFGPVAPSPGWQSHKLTAAIEAAGTRTDRTA
jgi:hypothetical protein